MTVKNTSDKSVVTRLRKELLLRIIMGIIVVASFGYWLYQILKVVSA